MHLFFCTCNRLKEKHDHIIRRVSNHCHFGLKFFIYDHKWCDNSMDIKYTHNIQCVWLCELWAVNCTCWYALYTSVISNFKWQIDTMCMRMRVRMEKNSLFGICHAFFMWVFIILFSSVHCRCWHHIASLQSFSLFFFSPSETVHQLKWADITLI